MMKLSQYLDRSEDPKAKFAVALGITPSTLADLLSGRRQPSPKLAVKIEGITNGAVRVEDWERFAVLKHRLVPETGGGE